MVSEEVTEILSRGEFERLIGESEDEQLDFKKNPYRLEDERQKMELAKDVSALANANGGLILIGVEARKDLDRQVEEAEIVNENVRHGSIRI